MTFIIFVKLHSVLVVIFSLTNMNGGKILDLDEYDPNPCPSSQIHLELLRKLDRDCVASKISKQTERDTTHSSIVEVRFIGTDFITTWYETLE